MFNLFSCTLNLKYLLIASYILKLSIILSLLKMSTKNPEQITFIYNGVEYDATAYVNKHPGGSSFIQNMHNERKDFTQYFKTLHSEQAQKVLQSFPIVATSEPSKNSKDFYKMLRRVQHLYKPIWAIQAALVISLASTFLIACTTQIAIVSILLFGFTQIVIGWVGHSMAHNRHPLFMKYGSIPAGLIGGFSLSWWSPKHNMHHIFTNSQLYDEDIQHEYKIYLYEFLYLKWRFDSFIQAAKNKQYRQVLCILVNYVILFYFYENLVYFVIGELLAGFYSAFVLIGNHEREHRYNQKIQTNFIDHQLITCRNYLETSFFWLIMMGGMQYQVEHHLFPQIPFYRLPEAVPIIKQELVKLNKSIIYGPVI